MPNLELNQDIVIRFASLEELTACDHEVNFLKTLLDDITKIKFKFLCDDESLLRSYESLVLKGLVSEEEFWDQKEEIREWNKITSMANQTLARTSKNLIKSLYTGGNTKIEGMKLDEIGKMKLLKREERLMEQYRQEVLENKVKEEDFWKEFEKQQKEKNTVLVGGINPIYIGELEVKRAMDLEMEVDLNRNAETFDLTAQLFESSKGEQKKSLIDKFNERNIRVLKEELLAEESYPKRDDIGLDDDYMCVEENDKKQMEMFDKTFDKTSIAFNNKRCLKDIERKPYGWEEEAWNHIKGQMETLKGDVSIYKSLVFEEENKQVRNVFEQMLRSINQKLSKKNIGFSHNEEEAKAFEVFWKGTHMEANKVLNFLYLNDKKAKECKDEKLKLKYSNNCKEIKGLLEQLRERLLKFRVANAKLGEYVMKCLNNLQDRIEIALKYVI